MGNISTRCEMWDLTPPPIPPRSRLFHLQPLGVGTAYVESLTSYTVRLAMKHSILTKTLVQREILPLLGNLSATSRQTVLSMVFTEVGPTVNGTSDWAREWTNILSGLTLWDDLLCLTMTTWAEVIAGKRLVRQKKAWCPLCFEEWATRNEPIYEPLLWALSGIAICPVHLRRLAHQCPHCQKPQVMLSQNAPLGHCYYCGGWLGVLEEANPNHPAQPRDDELEWQTWAIRAAGELLAVAPQLPASPQKQRIADMVSMCADQLAGGNTARLGRELGIHVDTVQKWRHGDTIPSFDLLLQMCYRLGISPLRFLTEEPCAIDPTTARLLDLGGATGRVKKPGRRGFDVEAARTALEKILATDPDPALSLKEVARRLGYDPSHLRQRLPLLCAAISAKYLAYRRREKERKLRQIHEEVRRVILEIHAQGVYPTTSLVMERLARPNDFRRPGVRELWYDLVNELGWRRE